MSARKSAVDTEAIKHFNPMMTYTMETATLRELHLRWSPPVFWNGQVFEIKSRKLAPGVYHVWCEVAA